MCISAPFALYKSIERLGRAKFNLEGPGEWEKMYRELHNEDVRGVRTAKVKKNPDRRGIWEDGHAPESLRATGIFDERSDDESDNDGGDDDASASELDLNDGTETGPLPKKKRKRGTGETRKEISWIWQTTPIRRTSGDKDDILQAEWARSRARVRRTSEEVALVREEMRRVLESLEWSAAQWGFEGKVQSKWRKFGA